VSDPFDRFLKPDPHGFGKTLGGLAKYLGFFLKRPRLLGLIFLALVLLGAANNSKDFILLPISLALILGGVLLRRKGL
jgi:hypothetical protein